MDDSWKQSLMTGDQCALCEEPLGEEPVELEEDGRLLMICGKCALERRRATSEQGHTRPEATELLQAAQTRATILDEILEYRQAEESQLQGLRDFIDQMADALTASEAAAEDLRRRLRQSEADLAKLEDRLRRMEKSSARMQSVSLPEQSAGPAEPAEPGSAQGHFPPPTPEISLEPENSRSKICAFSSGCSTRASSPTRCEASAAVWAARWFIWPRSAGNGRC